MKIRIATQQDLPEILALFENTIKSTCKNDYTPKQLEVWTSSVQNIEKWENRINSQYFVVAELDNTIVGFCSIENNNYLDVLYIHKDYLRKGIANKLYTEIEHKANKLGSDSLEVDASITAKPFFEKQGFDIVKQNNNIINGIEIINYRMIKHL